MSLLLLQGYQSWFKEMTNENSIKLNQYLTVDQVACALQVAHEYIRTLIETGNLESINLPGEINNPVRISAKSFARFIADCACRGDFCLQEAPRQSQPQNVYTGVFAV